MSNIKMVDRMANFVLARVNTVDLIREYFPEYMPDENVSCPYHSGGEEAKPSLHINMEGKAYCHSCGWKATNIIDFYAKQNGISYLQARKELYNSLVNSIHDSYVLTSQSNLRKRKRPMAYLTKTRGLTTEIIERFRLGYEVASGRITIPVIDFCNTCVNLRRVGWDKTRKYKYKILNEKGHGKVRLFCENLVVNEDRILLVEGEWDAIIGRQVGLPACSWTGGATSWNEEYNWLFRHKEVFILYDNDKAGREGAEQAKTQAMRAGAAYVKVCEHLPVKGKDLNEWYLKDSVAVEFFETDFYAFTTGMSDRVNRGLCPYCGQGMP